MQYCFVVIPNCFYLTPEQSNRGLELIQLIESLFPRSIILEYSCTMVYPGLALIGYWLLVEPGLVLCARLILPCKDSRLMLCKMAFWYSGKVVTIHLNNSTAEAICVIKVVLHLLFFAGWPVTF